MNLRRPMLRAGLVAALSIRAAADGAVAEGAAGAGDAGAAGTRATSTSSATDGRMALVPAGEYAPLFRGAGEPERVAVAAFAMEVFPVTNAGFLEFVRANPAWRRSMRSPLFADENYLSHWAGDLAPGANAPLDAPVVRVSWFAARAYAAWRGARLPTTAEWERAAGVGIDSDNAATDPAARGVIATWFARPTPEVFPAVGGGRANRLGLHDLHGLVWEWVEDFNAALVTGESRGDDGLERDLFCGAGSVGARDKTNYPAFMRAGFRSSLRAAYTVPNLGFRCVRSP